MIADPPGHRQSPVGPLAALGVRDAVEGVERQERLEPRPGRAVLGRQQRERPVQEPDHLAVLAEEVAPGAELVGEQRLGHARPVARGLGVGRHLTERRVAAAVARQPQGRRARKVDVEPLRDGRVRQPVVRARRARS